GGDAEVALEVRVVVPAERGHALARPQAGRLERGGQAPGAAVEVGEAVAGEGLVGQAGDDLGFGVELAGALQQVIRRERHALHGRPDHGASFPRWRRAVKRRFTANPPGAATTSCRSRPCLEAQRTPRTRRKSEKNGQREKPNEPAPFRFRRYS